MGLWQRHGHARKDSPFRSEYLAWRNMRRRCSAEYVREFHNYGGRGIEVCERWQNDFQAFLDDVGIRPSKDHSLDRIDNDGNYEPDNVRWATRKQQQRNTRANRLIEFDGRRMTIADWTDETGIAQDTIRGRLERGWSARDTLKTPVGSRGRCYLELGGERHTVAEWARRTGVSAATIYSRVRKGWSDTESIQGRAGVLKVEIRRSS